MLVVGMQRRRRRRALEAGWHSSALYVEGSRVVGHDVSTLRELAAVFNVLGDSAVRAVGLHRDHDLRM